MGDCFSEFLLLVTKSGIAFYLIIYFIYILLLIRKYFLLTVRTLYRTPTNCILTLILNNFIGLNNSNSKKLCKKFGFQEKCTIKDLDSLDLERLKNYLTDNFLLGKSLTEQTNKNVKKKIDLGTYKGKRHNLGYPVRGQRTLSNGKTQRNLHKFRFYYNVDLFSHSFFKNKRKSFKNKKIAKLK